MVLKKNICAVDGGYLTIGTECVSSPPLKLQVYTDRITDGVSLFMYSIDKDGREKREAELDIGIMAARVLAHAILESTSENELDDLREEAESCDEFLTTEPSVPPTATPSR